MIMQVFRVPSLGNSKSSICSHWDTATRHLRGGSLRVLAGAILDARIHFVGIACVDHQVRLFNELPEVVAALIGDNKWADFMLCKQCKE